MKKIYNILIILLLLNVAGGALLWFGYGRIQALKTEEATLMLNIAEADQKSRRLVTLRQTLYEAKKERDELASFLVDPREENQIKLIAQIEELGASTTGATVNVTAFNLTTGKEPVIHGDFSFSGQWRSMYHFLSLIESLPTKLIISRFSLQESGQGTPQEKWSGVLSVDFVALQSQK